MGIGISVFLLAAGAILTFAVNATISGLDINVIGVILMLAGLVGLVITLAILGRNRGTVGRERIIETPRDRVIERDVY